MRTNVFAFFFTLCVMLPFAGVTQHGNLHNGFIAATNNGLYYLQYGFDEWLRLNSEKSIGVSYNKYTLLSKQITGYDKIYGLKNKVDFTTESFSDENKKLFTSKFNLKSYYYLGELLVDFDTSYYGVMGYWYNNIWKWSNPMIVVNNPSLSTDNDSTLVIVGSNNTLKKLVFSSSYQSISYNATTVTGLTSNTSSAHQICYDSNNDLFWIVSDEGIIYNYDKTNVLEISEVVNCDSVSDISVNKETQLLTINYHNTFDNYWVSSVFDLTDFSFLGDYALMNDLDYPIFSAESSTKTLTVNSIGQISEYVSGTPAARNDIYLPVGTVVYDLEYIDYFPYVFEWDYETTMTVGTNGYNAFGYGYSEYGGLTPDINGISYLFWWGSYSSLNIEGQLIIDNHTNALLSIDGVEYDMTYEDGYVFCLNVTENPFPPVGEPCEIKIKFLP